MEVHWKECAHFHPKADRVKWKKGMSASVHPWAMSHDSQCLSAIACAKNLCINELETGRVGQSMNKLTDRQTYDLRVALEPFVQPLLLLVLLEADL